MKRIKKQKAITEKKKKSTSRSIYYFTIDVSSLDPSYNNNIKNIFSNLNDISNGNIIFDNISNSNSFNAFLQINEINNENVFITYGKKETATQHSGRGEIDKENLSLLLPEYSSDITDVYIGYCVIDFTHKIGAYFSSNATSPETCIRNIVNNNIAAANINIYDIGKNKQELKKLKTDVKKIKSLSYATKNITSNDIKVPFGNSLPIKKATIKIYYDNDYITENELNASLDDFVNDLDNDDLFLAKYQKLKFDTISTNDFSQIIDLKKSLSVKKSVVDIFEEDLYDSSKIQEVLINQLNRFISDYLPTR